MKAKHVAAVALAVWCVTYELVGTQPALSYPWLALICVEAVAVYVAVISALIAADPFSE